MKAGSEQRKDQAWIEEGDLKVVKVASSLVSSLKKVVKVASSMVLSLKEVCDTFVTTVSRLDISGAEIQSWLFSEKSIQVDVKRFSSSLFWIKPLLQKDFFN